MLLVVRAADGWAEAVVDGPAEGTVEGVADAHGSGAHTQSVRSGSDEQALPADRRRFWRNPQPKVPALALGFVMQDPEESFPVQMLQEPAGTAGQHVTVAAADCTRRAKITTVLNMTACKKDVFVTVVKGCALLLHRKVML